MKKAELLNLLSSVKSIALVGASPKTHRPSYEVMRFLQNKGVKVYPVNPIHAGQKILNEQVYASLEDIPVKVDMVEIFRNSEAAGETCKDVLALSKGKKPEIVWMQIGVINEQAAETLRAKKYTVVMDECPKRLLS
jgi:predicted CoA-binding protein